jgi:outer membrane protein, multidrug efflux system
MKRRLVLALTALTTLLAGCASAPTPVQPQAALTAAGAAPSFAEAPAGLPAGEPAALFWQRFGDAELSALVQDALKANADVRLATARLAEARALGGLARSANWPRVDTSASVARSRSPDGSGGSDTGNLYALGLEARWEADLFGRRRDEQRAADADIAASLALQQAAQLAVAADVARAYFELQGTLQRLQVAEESLKTQRAALDLVQARLAAGRGTALDSERAKALVLGTEASVPALQLQAVLLRQRLAVLAGQPPQALATRLAAARPLPGLAAVSLASVGSPQSLLRRRPDLIAAEAQANAAASRLGLSYKATLPQVVLSGSLGLNAGRLSALGNSASFVYNLAAGLAWNLVDGGANEARLDAARARQLAAVVAYEKAVLAALEETEGAFATYSRTQRQTELLFDAAQSAERAAAIARERFSVGVSDFLAVLDAERERLAARDRLAQAQTASVLSVVGVYRALAGGVGE